MSKEKLAYFIGTGVAFFFSVWLEKMLWNYYAGDFSLPLMTYWRMAGLSILISFLFHVKSVNIVNNLDKD